MKDQLIELVEAVRLARLELDCFRDPNCRASERWTLARLTELLMSEHVNTAMAKLALDEKEGSPSIVPEDALSDYASRTVRMR